MLEIGNCSLKFEELSEDAKKLIKEPEKEGLFVFVIGTKIKYSGMISKYNSALHAKKGSIPFEVGRLEEYFSELKTE
ncbi:tRNA (cytosine-5-)-methyltransferase protein [Trichomonas vaginalis G3]|uniref:tRNA (cytosine-5-)-methyltransferase protein n=1 Tax=Trichomonas vaginalis (strain ATCC PRA-98 / G3) TaxID=412133 RepID=UPI0021E5374F|nr:tRNA (cytosine-5-)-methyltransferase protein [Trichomonas vaginalis G3]KAI5532254.1 tRNA (cytosine-5-)-methyltransferase protein [Trichomonas vaginalis G3]